MPLLEVELNWSIVTFSAAVTKVWKFMITYDWTLTDSNLFVALTMRKSKLTQGHPKRSPLTPSNHCYRTCILTVTFSAYYIVGISLGHETSYITDSILKILQASKEQFPLSCSGEFECIFLFWNSERTWKVQWQEMQSVLKYRNIRLQYLPSPCYISCRRYIQGWTKTETELLQKTYWYK